MLSAVVLALDGSAPVPVSADGIVRTLASLVPAAIEGIVRDVVLAATASNPDLRQIADHAGCELTEASEPEQVISAALAAARGDLILVLRAGFAPEQGFAEEIADLFQRAVHPAAIRFREQPETFMTRLLPGIARVQGLVARRASLDPKSPHLAALVRHCGNAPTARSRLRRVD